MSSRLKSKFYKVVVRLASLNEVEYWLVTKLHIQKMRVTGVKMLTWISRHSRRNRIRNGAILDKVGVTLVVEKLREARLK